ncbi:MAG: DUF3500 domain-containing protein [Planctomycetota bacterium]
MRQFMPLGLVAVLGLAAAFEPSAAQAVLDAKRPLAFQPAAPDGVTAMTVAAAARLQAALNDEQRARLVLDEGDEAQRVRWSNLPTGIFTRAGIRMGELDDPQRGLVFALLGAFLSPEGVQAVRDNMDADETLTSGAPRGGIAFGKGEYYLSLRGAPSLEQPFTLQFGGHHLALNAAFLGARVTLSPLLTGGQPMHYKRGDEAVSQMDTEVTRAYALVAALDDAQRARAVVAAQPIDLTWGPGRESAEDATRPPAAVGIPASALNDDERKQLLALVHARLALLNTSAAAARLAEVEAELSALTFAWFGSTRPGELMSYRVQGPSVFMEYAPQGRGPAAAEHVHAIYRDPTNDYGRALARK